MGADTPPDKICFVIAPIGAAGSDIRNRSDKVFRHVIQPVAQACGYKVIRSDVDPRPGMIGQQIIQHILDDDLVIADLTGHNANVFYELAIRHMVEKPIVQIIQDGERLPFDIVQTRTIFLDHTDLDSVELCKSHLRNQIHEVESNPKLVDNPISQTVKLKALEQSTDPDAQRDATILRRLNEIGAQVSDLAAKQQTLEMQRWLKRTPLTEALPDAKPTSLTITELALLLDAAKRRGTKDPLPYDSWLDLYMESQKSTLQPTTSESDQTEE